MRIFIWDFSLATVMEQIVEWIYGQVVGFLSNFFGSMGNMGAELFGLVWVQGVVGFFGYIAWTLYVVGLVVAVFEYAISAQGGSSSPRDMALNAVKGFMAVSLFMTTPIELYKFSISIQIDVTNAITGYGTSFSELMANITTGLESGSIAGLPQSGDPFFMLFATIMMAYAVVKVFMDNLKRGGILLIQIAVGSLYMFSIPTHQFIFNAGNTDAQFFMDNLQLEPSEFELIRYPQRGVCLFKCGNERYNLMVHAPEHKERLFGKAGGR